MSNYSVYFGGSRHLRPGAHIVRDVVQAVIRSGCAVQVGCQVGADAQVISAALGQNAAHRLSVFSVCHDLNRAPSHVQSAAWRGAQVVLGAGGPETIPAPARLLRRSIAAFQGCGQAVFFFPGPGSLAVARECIKSGLPVFAFSEALPAAVPEIPGTWQPVESSSYYAVFSVQCWAWQPAQKSLF